MNFADERYVRLYSRDTPGWLAMPWQGRALAPLLLRKLDRAGMMEIGDEDHAAVVSAVVALPVEVVMVGLAALLRRDTVRIVDGVLVWPKYLEAQEIATSDKLRARESRERRRDGALSGKAADASRNVTTTEDAVTKRDAPPTPRDETSLRTVPCRTVPIRTEPIHAESVRAPADAVAPPGPTPTTTKAGKKRAACPIPEDFTVSPAMETMCRAEMLANPHVVLPRFRDWALAGDKSGPIRKADWEATFRGWMRSPITARDYPVWTEPTARAAQAAPPQLGLSVVPRDGAVPAPPEALAAMRALALSRDAGDIAAEALAESVERPGSSMRLRPPASAVTADAPVGAVAR